MSKFYYIMAAIWWNNTRTNPGRPISVEMCGDHFISRVGDKVGRWCDIYSLRDFICEQAGVPYGTLPCGATGYNFTEIEPLFDALDGNGGLNTWAL